MWISLNGCGPSPGSVKPVQLGYLPYDDLSYYELQERLKRAQAKTERLVEEQREARNISIRMSPILPGSGWLVPSSERSLALAKGNAQTLERVVWQKTCPETD